MQKTRDEDNATLKKIRLVLADMDKKVAEKLDDIYELVIVAKNS